MFRHFLSAFHTVINRLLMGGKIRSPTYVLSSFGPELLVALEIIKVVSLQRAYVIFRMLFLSCKFLGM